MKGHGYILLCFLASISVGVARLGTTFNRTLSGENRSLFDDYSYDRSLFNRSLEYGIMNFNRSLFNRSLESRRLLDISNLEEQEDFVHIRGLFSNRTLQANRTLEADEFEHVLSGYNRSLEYEHYNRSLYNRTL